MQLRRVYNRLDSPGGLRFRSPLPRVAPEGRRKSPRDLSTSEGFTGAPRGRSSDTVPRATASVVFLGLWTESVRVALWSVAGASGPADPNPEIRVGVWTNPSVRSQEVHRPRALLLSFDNYPHATLASSPARHQRPAPFWPYGPGAGLPNFPVRPSL